MDEDAEVAEAFQDSLESLKQEKEVDFLRLSRIQERFDKFKDKDRMMNIPNSQYDLIDSEGENYSTEFTDHELNDLYQRHKLI